MRLVLVLMLASQLAACSPSSRAMKALARGDQCEFCRISAMSAGSDHASNNNLGVCYENGWCGFQKDTSAAIRQYHEAARWGVEQAKRNLIRLGVQPPPNDLQMAEDAQDRQLLLGALAAGLLAAGAATANSAPTYNSYQAPQANTFMVVDPAQGCCSHHGGIRKDILGNFQCHFSGMILCQDFQPSPSCRCP